MQRAFHEEHALQCGYCTPGMIMSATHLLARNPNPTEDEIRHGLEGNLCRCTGYQNIVEAVQDKALGLGHAVGCAESALTDDDDAVAVLLPDDLVLPSGVLTRMAEVRARYGGSVLCAFDIPREEISAYGVFDVADTEDADVKRVHGMVEKPSPEDAPSTFAAAGRYLLDRAVFDGQRVLRRREHGLAGHGAEA